MKQKKRRKAFKLEIFLVPNLSSHSLTRHCREAVGQSLPNALGAGGAAGAVSDQTIDL